jgi:hypothetical protein
MATKKITLNELRTLVKQIIKEEYNSNKEIYGQNLPLELYYGSPGYPWKIIVTSYEEIGNKIVLNVFDKDDEENMYEIELIKPIFNRLDERGFVQFTSRSGGYTILGLFSDDNDDDIDYENDDYNNLKRPGKEGPYYGQGGAYPYNR